jgi:hypothetical protein
MTTGQFQSGAKHPYPIRISDGLVRTSRILSSILIPGKYVAERCGFLGRFRLR